MPAREIGGGRFFVNAKPRFTRSIRPAGESAIAKDNQFGECPRRPGRGVRAMRSAASHGPQSQTPATSRRAQRIAFMAPIRPSAARALGALVLAAAVIAAVLAGSTAGLRAQDADPVVARANGVDIRQS